VNPRYPVFIPSKGRYESRLTSKTFDRLGVPYIVVVEPQEADAYRRALADSPGATVLVTPHHDEGVTVTRNFIWDYAEASGADRYWTFDDNINGLFRYNFNLKTPVCDGTVIRCMEDWTDRYTNVAMSGPNYFMFVSRKGGRQPPLYWNTRVYSANLIKTDLRYPDTGEKVRWVTFFNEDTDLSLRMLKAGWCTAVFNAFLIGKIRTMMMKGGNTEFYEETDDRKEFVEELQRHHPNFVELTWKWGRWHHHVDYSVFKHNKPEFVPGIELSSDVDNYGMILEKLDEDTSDWYQIERP